MTVTAANWRPSDLRAWNHILLKHFFQRRVEIDGPVTTLLVTPEELARAVGAPTTSGPEVRDAFVGVVLQHVRRDRGLLEEASEYPDWPKAPPEFEIPHFVAHLLFTCIAASESSDDLEDEQSFVRRLRELSDDRLPDRQLEMLPVLWRNLATWLTAGENRKRYRQLVLPDPGGLTRIGFTVRLTFPDRRDQHDLSALLDELELQGVEPPVHPVLAAVTAHRSRFSRRFLGELDSFRREFDGAPGAAHLREHRFWAAVRDAALRGRGAETDFGQDSRVQMLGLVEDDRMVVFLASNGATTADGRLRYIEMPVSYGEWSHAVVTAGDDLSGPGLASATAAVLDGSIKLPRISALVDQGLLAFVEGMHGALELSSGVDLEATTLALVRDDLADDVISALEAKSARSSPSAYEGWTQLEDLTFRRLPFSILERGELKTCWQLHEMLPALSILLVGGIRTDDGWLGFRETLPRVSARNCSEVLLLGPDGQVERLESLESESWQLPARDLVGTFELVADPEGSGACRKIVRFYSSTAADEYRRPQDVDAWMVERMAGYGHLDADTELAAADSGFDAEALCERVVHLGPAHGEFVEGPDDAAWRVVLCDREKLIRRVRPELCVRPTHQVDDPAARRRWRKVLLGAKPADAGSRAALASVGTRFPVLPTLDRPTAAPHATSAERRGVEPHSRVERLVSIVAARSSNRSGIGLREWQESVICILGLPPSERWEYVTRAWQESGIIDVGSFARWREMRVFARPPRFVAVRSGSGVRAAFSGLATEPVRARALEIARSCGAIADERRSYSPLVPKTFSALFPDVETFLETLRTTGLDARWLEVGVLEDALQPNFQEPPLGYDASPWERWSLEPASTPPGVLVTRCTRPNGPNYWALSADRFRMWSYDRNLARLWACAAVNESPVSVGDRELRARHAFMPLPLARAVAALGPALPGFDPTTSAYRYALASDSAVRFVSNAMRRAFDRAMFERGD